MNRQLPNATVRAHLVPTAERVHKGTRPNASHLHAPVGHRQLLAGRRHAGYTSAMRPSSHRTHPPQTKLLGCSRRTQPRARSLRHAATSAPPSPPPGSPPRAAACAWAPRTAPRHPWPTPSSSTAPPRSRSRWTRPRTAAPVRVAARRVGAPAPQLRMMRPAQPRPAALAGVVNVEIAGSAVRAGMFWRSRPEMGASVSAPDWPRNGAKLRVSALTLRVAPR